MQIAGKRLSAIALAACLFAALALGGAAAIAAGGFPEEGENTLTATAANNPDEAFMADIATANVVVDAYKIADAQPDENYVAYNYTLIAPFDALTMVDADKATAETWKELAEGAAKLVTADMTPITVPADGATAASLPDDGLYLLLPHGAADAPEYGADVLDSLIAGSELYEYRFAPSITAAPTKEAAEDGSIGTAEEYGDWLRAISVTLKPERGPRYGSLRIEKSVTEFANDEPATFVFHIVGTTPEGDAYENYAAVTLDGSTSGETVVEHIPAGTVFTVEEVHTGTRYELVSGDSSEKTIVADGLVEAGTAEMASAAFVNRPNGNSTGGHGIQNNFTLGNVPGEGESAWDWVWTATPAQGSGPEQS